jgi:broad specificity phosphatase PhoE
MRLYLLRHGKVSSHRGDVPITAAAEEQSRAAGVALAKVEAGPIRILTGETTRAKDTATHLALGLIEGGVKIVGPTVAFALRNPDLYVSGVRVNMVSSGEALAEQVEGLSPEEVPSLEFYPEFFASEDRIGWWLRHQSPPGERAADVAGRMRSFISSLGDPTPLRSDTVIAVTHSPLLRAVGLDFFGEDTGEPPWVSGLLVHIGDDGAMEVERFAPVS